MTESKTYCVTIKLDRYVPPTELKAVLYHAVVSIPFVKEASVSEVIKLE